VAACQARCRPRNPRLTTSCSCPVKPKWTPSPPRQVSLTSAARSQKAGMTERVPFTCSMKARSFGSTCRRSG
jgi:hypothetical protein